MKKRVVRSLPENAVITVDRIPRNAIIGVKVNFPGDRYFIEQVNGRYYLSGMTKYGIGFNNNATYNSIEELIKVLFDYERELYLFDTAEELYRWLARVDD